ncbi:hypothetical protein [Caballeronia sp. LZ034LL]|uniref:hypothetical protein n=1 Tax=Caballeronia sp. LZ034LL TaxID=3038567 RepID=UPI0028567826|nr:hypothetical protein [Caballeronia sp. LZ034LL]MDR5838759.1 hypothetical protein [Caballeronia sp. LZ034LL]
MIPGRFIDFPVCAQRAVVKQQLNYHAHYSLDPATHTIRITRTLGADFGKQACSPGDSQTALRKMERDTRQQIIVRMTS